MSIIYLALFVAVCAVMLAVLFEGVVAVARRPAWPQQRMPLQLKVIETVDRRTGELPFVGSDRRVSSATDVTPQAERLAA